ncbi:hypothetical protein [Haloferax sp. DFSO52]|uniref:hypothetical protein n=1 Tax=Haloferax sp. DFSO52 TaxID=3388505 RepID=UPI003A8B1D11
MVSRRQVLGTMGCVLTHGLAGCTLFKEAVIEAPFAKSVVHCANVESGDSNIDEISQSDYDVMLRVDVPGAVKNVDVAKITDVDADGTAHADLSFTYASAACGEGRYDRSDVLLGLDIVSDDVESILLRRNRQDSSWEKLPEHPL